MSKVTGFAPIADSSAHILVLGSMPGIISLKSNQYYAHPRNAFWRIMASLYHFNAEATYSDRVAALITSGIAVWDVLKSCVRPGSLDCAIEAGSRVPNDFPTFFDDHSKIKLVAFNGAEAEKSFNRYVRPQLSLNDIRFVRLPSSRPAHVVSLENKIAAWKKALDV